MTPTSPRQIGHFAAAYRCTGSTRTRRAGLTLIEVAVALVVFVIGALAIVQIFPPLLGEVQNSESRTIASRLNDSTLARLGDDPDLVPDAIYNDDGSGGFQSVASSVTGTATLNNSLPDVSSASNASAFENSFKASALDHFKRVVGERQVVLPGATDNFVLTRFPYEEGSVRLYAEGEVKGVTINDIGTLDFSESYTASLPTFNDTDGIAEHSNRPLWRSSNSTTYYVSYRWMEGGEARGVTDEPIVFPTDGSWMPDISDRVLIGRRLTTSPGSVGPIVPGPVVVRYRAEQIAPATSSLVGERGYLPLAGIEAGTIVSLDYTVRDWRNLVDDRVLDQRPAPDTNATYVAGYSDPRAVRLPVRNLEVEPSVWAFGLLWDRASATEDYDVQVLTNVISSHTDAENGLVYYDANGLTAPRARTVYRTIDNWTHQLAVAARSYLPFYADYAGSADGRNTDDLPREPWREYFVYTDSTNNVTLLCFHPGEAGKTIAVSYAEGNAVTNNKVVTIGMEIKAGSAYGGDADFYQGSDQVAVAELPGTVSILSVRGLSLHARTAWINGDRWTQNALVGYRKQ